jgi:UDP-glucose 4-epimerase
MDTPPVDRTRRLVVTGGTGFVGREFLRQAIAAGYHVDAIHRNEVPSGLAAGVNWIRSDLNSVPKEILRASCVLVHFAAAGVITGGNDWEACFEANVHQSVTLWRRAAAAGIKRMIVCGSCFEYGRAGERFERIPVSAPLEPVTAYAASKAAASCAALALAADAQLSLSLLRPFHVFGDGEPAGRFWPSLRDAALAGRDFPMTEGTQVRDFTPVSIVASEFLAEVRSPGPRPGAPLTRNLGTGNPQSLLAFARDCWTSFSARGKLLPGAVPMRINEVMRYVPEITPLAS